MKHVEIKVTCYKKTNWQVLRSTCKSRLPSGGYMSAASNFCHTLHIAPATVELRVQYHTCCQCKAVNL